MSIENNESVRQKVTDKKKHENTTNKNKLGDCNYHKIRKDKQETKETLVLLGWRNISQIDMFTSILHIISHRLREKYQHITVAV